ncbi:MAG: ABC transporter substrate-binding protein [Oscillospiraceae bacterium]|nr:ABC transporter substrate-binding protein [Oscillospiraceae bacterium]
MKTMKSILALVLVCCLALCLFTACSDKPGDAGQKPGSSTEEPIEVIAWFADVYGHGGDHGERLNEAVNRITEPQGITVKLSLINIGDWLAKVQTSIIGGERVDLMTYSINCGVTSMITQKMAMDMTDYLKADAPETMELMKDYLDADSVNGRIFGVPTLRSYVTNGYVCFQKDALDELGLTEKAQNLDSWSGLEEILGKLAEANKGTSRYAFCGGIGTVIASTGYMIHGDKWSDIEVVDTLGDSANVIYADKEGHVSLAQKQESFIEACKIAKEWMDNGWIFPDSIYDSAMSAQETIGAGGALSEICTSEIGLEAMKQQIYKAPALCVKLYTGNIKTGTLTGWGMGLPVTCEEPEGAVKLINMLYTNSDLMKVLVNGEEGVDYELVDGQAKQIENQFSQGNFIYGNNLLTLPVYGTGADLYERVDKMNKEAECSPYLGFNLNTADLDLVLSQINAVTDQYRCAIASGGYSDAYFNEYMEKLEAAGVQDYIDAVQAQLSAWMESK